MKKIYLYLLLNIPLLLSAQTITQGDLPGAGSAWTMAIDTNYVAPVPAGGAGQTWDYSGLLTNDVDTTGFIAAAGTPYAAQFPGSNLATHDVNDDSYAYFTTNSTGLYSDGFVNGSTMIMFNPGQLFIPVPFSLNDTRDNSARFQIDTSFTDTSGTTLNYRIVHQVDEHFLADGSGSLTTPTGNYPSVLRIKITEVTYDSLLVDPLGFGIYVPISTSISQITNYNFVTSGNTVNYIMGLEADSLGTTTTASRYLLDATVDVPKVSQNQKVVLYPNPVVNSISFRNVSENSSIVIFDSKGNEVYRSKDIFNKSIASEMLNNGVYHYEIISGDSHQKGSFVIQH